MSDFDLLLSSGQIGKYQSCRLTLVNLHHKPTGINTVAFARFFMQEEPVSLKGFQNLGGGKLDDETSFGVFEYDLDLNEAVSIYKQLAEGKGWHGLRGSALKVEDTFKQLERKYTGPAAAHRENNFLKQTPAGSHWIEFFNERKQTIKTLYTPFEQGPIKKIAPTVKELCGIDLDIAIDRLGNIIFQFPVMLLTPKVQQLGDRSGLEITFNWATNVAAPPTLVLTQKREEGSVKDFEIIRYDSSPAQIVPVKNLNNLVRIQIARMEPTLLLYEWECECAPPTNVQITTGDGLERTVNLPDSSYKIALSAFNTYINTIPYLEHVQIAEARQEKNDYYQRFYHGDHEKATNYIRSIIQKSHSREILVMDPYMYGKDIL